MAQPETTTESYNERLFQAPGLRKQYHLARYHWISRNLQVLELEKCRMVELGCYDGKLLSFLNPQPRAYVGLDANWENGLDLARRKHVESDTCRFIETTTPETFRQFADGEFDVAVSLETLEHLPPDRLDEYLAELSRVTLGRLFVSVPNEMGPVFAAKHLFKLIRLGDADRYSWTEFLAATAWRPDKVQRDEHKGFDYRQLVRQIARHFTIERIEGIPQWGLPPSLSLTVGIVARAAREGPQG